MSFCWWTSKEVEAFGNSWTTEDKQEQQLAENSNVRCLRGLGYCLYAHSHRAFGVTTTGVDLYRITRWDDNEIEAVSKDAPKGALDCERDSLIINRTERSVLLISSPGPYADEKRCTSYRGAPKTVVYRLSQEKPKKTKETGQ